MSDYFEIKRCETSDVVIIAFSAIDTLPGKFMFWHVLSKVEANIIFLNCANNSWYIDGVPSLGVDLISTLKSIESIICEIGAKRVVTIGSSMGGYGALLYGAMLGVDHVIATGTETVLNVDGGNSILWLKGRTLTQNIFDIINKNKTSVHLLYGEWYAPDLACAQAILDRCPSVRVSSVRNFGHDIPAYLENKYGLDNIIQKEILGDGFKLDDKDAGIILAERDLISLYHMIHVAYIAPVSDTEIGMKLLPRLKDKLNSCSEHIHPHIFHLLSMCAYIIGDFALAASYAQNAIELNEFFYLHHYQKARCLIQTQDVNAALVAVERSMQLENESINLVEWNNPIIKVQALHRSGRNIEAKSILKNFIEKFPNHQFAKNLLEVIN